MNDKVEKVERRYFFVCFFYFLFFVLDRFLIDFYLGRPRGSISKCYLLWWLIMEEKRESSVENYES